MSKVTPFLMFDGQLEAAIELYRTILPGFEVKQIARTGKDGPVQSAEFVLGGQTFKAFDGGPHFAFSEAFSIYVDCKDQSEVDEYWERIERAGGTPTACGWIKDPFGVSWQIVPRRFVELIADEDPERVQTVIDAMLKMKKLDVATLEAAYESAAPTVGAGR